MQSVGTRNTGPELAVRRVLHALGLRFRVHRRDLPGRPDIVLARYRTAIFVHGCFWHGHDCPKGRLPKSRPEYWAPKIDATRLRDARAVQALTDGGWQSLIVWQCELRDPAALEANLRFVFGKPEKIDRLVLTA